MIQPGSLSEIRGYLIRLDNEHRAMKKIKEKESITKVRTTKQVIFAEELPKTNFYRTAEAISTSLSPRPLTRTAFRTT